MYLDLISKLEDIGSLEEKLVTCNLILSEDQLPYQVREKILLKAMNTAEELHMDEETEKLAVQYFSILSEGSKPAVSSLMIYVPILFGKGEIYKVEDLLLLWKLIAFTGKSHETDTHYLYIHGTCLGIRKKFKESTEVLKQGLELCKKTDQNDLYVSISANLGAMFFKQKKYDEALSVLEKAYNNSLDLGETDISGHALVTYSTALIATGKKDKARELINIVLEGEVFTNDIQLHIAASIQLANLFKIEENVPEAIIVLEKILPSVNNLSDWHLSEVYYEKLIALYRLNENYKKAFYQLKICKEKSDKAFAKFSEEELATTRKIMKLSVKAREVKILDEKNIQLQQSNLQLKHALEEIKTLSGIIPVCTHCRKIRNDEGYWNSLETYLSNNSEALLSHSICPDCIEKVLEEI